MLKLCHPQKRLIDHWRHYFLLLGVLWGLMAVSRPYLAPVPAEGHLRDVPA
jgi:hypothetical protein